nr:ribosome small subunit-dependent GTPase A [Planobispora longispora]
MAVDRGRYTCLVESAGEKSRHRTKNRAEGAMLSGRLVVAMKARELGRKGIVVGDRVALVGDVSGKPDTLARVVRVEPRASMLRRSADDTDDTDGIERPVVANADQLVIVTALADPPPRPRMIDRMLVAAFDADIEPLLCLTKPDLAPPDELVAHYAPLGVPYVVIRRGGELDELRERLTDRISVLVGHSGVGKSTLVNALVPDANRAVSHVNSVTGRGRHTSTSAVALELPGAAGSSTPRACAASAWRTSRSRPSWPVSPTSSRGRSTAPRAAPTGARSAPWTPWSPRARRTRPAWPPCAGCSPAARAPPTTTAPPPLTAPTGWGAGSRRRSSRRPGCRRRS